MSVDWSVIERALRAWVAAGSVLPLQSVYWGQQDAGRPPEPALELKIFDTHTMGMAWLDTETAYVTLGPFTVERVTPGTATLTIPQHQLTNGDGPLRVTSTGALPEGLRTNTDYWVIHLDDDTIQLAASFAATGGADKTGHVSPVPFSDAGTGTITLSSTPQTVRGASPIRFVSRSLERITLMLTAYARDGVGLRTPLALLARVKAAQRLPSQQQILRGAHVALIEVERPRTVHGVRNAVLFEPRGIMEVHFNVPFEESEDGQAIERVTITSRLDAKRSRTANVSAHSDSSATLLSSADPLPGV